MRPAVFLDRDGTMIVDKDYLRRPEEVSLFPGACSALKRLSDHGYALVMVTNQSGVGRGYFTMEDVERVHAHLEQLLAAEGVQLAATYVAPEAPDQPSRARKPSPQFLFDARDTLGIDLSQSYMIGDKWIDVECGWNAGVKRSILVRTGYGTKVEQQHAGDLQRIWVADDLPQAADLILAHP